MLKTIVETLFPAYCVGCGRIGTHICRFCRPTVVMIGDTEMVCPVCQRPAIS